MLRRRRIPPDDFSTVNLLGRPDPAESRRVRTTAAPRPAEQSKTPAQDSALRQAKHHSGRSVAHARRAEKPLEAQGFLRRNRSEPKIRSQESLLVGRVNVSPRGFAFVTTDTSQAYYIKPPSARRLLTGDVIQFIPGPPAADGSFDVQEVRHLRRREQIFLCAVTKLGELTYFIPDEPCFTPVQISGSVAPDAFVVDDVIALRLPAYEGAPRYVTTPGGPLLGVLVGNLGPRTRNGFDLDYARMKHGFDQDMPAELNEVASTLENPAHLQPTTDLAYVTIDGESTKDFDDAVFAAPLADGGWRVLVAISDVSHYVAPGTTLDRWAASRGTSVYLPGLTLPMLPEGLSTERCSLMPNVTRRAVVMELELDQTGAVRSSTIRRELIRSAARLTYREVADFIETPASLAHVGDAVLTNLRTLHDVYKVLAARRKALGRLDFEDPEPTAKFRDGKLVVEWEVRNDAHKLIEELMLLANTEAAGMLVRRFGIGLFRHQPQPAPESWASLQKWAADQGKAVADVPSLRAMSDLVVSMPDGEPRAEAIMKVRMSMLPARYQTMTAEQLASQGGHFSLCAPWYTHFTSPIRRYPDLLVHRLLLAPDGYELSAADTEALRQAVEQCSDRSQASRLSERLMWDRLKLKGFLEEHGPDAVINARVVRVTPRGLRLVLAGWQVPAWLAGGMMRRAGFRRNDQDVWMFGEGDSAKQVRDGLQMSVSWIDVNLERPAYPELQVKIAEPAA